MNSRMDELQAAVLRVKLPHLEAWNRTAARRSRGDTRTTIATSGDRAAAVHRGTTTRVSRISTSCARSCATSLRAHLAAAGVATDVHYPVPDHRQAGCRRRAADGLPRTERACAEVLSLPCYPELTDAGDRRRRGGVQFMATRYSLVVPVYRNERAIPDLLAALVRLDGELDGALEVVLVVDGSPDRSLAALVEALPRNGPHGEGARHGAQLRRFRGDPRRAGRSAAGRTSR